MTFEEFYANNEYVTYDKTEYECMKLAWEYAYQQGFDDGFILCKEKDNEQCKSVQKRKASQRALNTPTIDEQGGGNTCGA